MALLRKITSEALAGTQLTQLNQVTQRREAITNTTEAERIEFSMASNNLIAAQQTQLNRFTLESENIIHVANAMVRDDRAKVAIDDNDDDLEDDSPDNNLAMVHPTGNTVDQIDNGVKVQNIQGTVEEEPEVS